MLEQEYRSLQRLMEIAELRQKGIQDTHLLDWNFRVAEDTPYVQMGKPFPQEAELAQKSQRLAELNSILDMDGKKNNSERDSENRDDTDRPSVLDDLHRRVEEMPPHRRTESRGLEERS